MKQRVNAADVAARMMGRSETAAPPERMAVVPWDLVVTCHRPYLGEFLNECLAAWPNAQIPGKRVLVLDRCGFGDLHRAMMRVTLPGWEIVEVDEGHPSGARNAGLERCQSLWVVFWDADNVPRPGLAQEFTQAIGRADAQEAYLGFMTPDDVRDAYGVDTNAAWRREAVLAVGGWPRAMLEDWRLGWTLQGAGWRLRRMLGEPIQMRRHALQRSKSATEDEKLWGSRKFGLMTIHRGDRALSERWLQSLREHELPPDLAVTVLVDGGQEEADWLAGEISAVLGPERVVRALATGEEPLAAPDGMSDEALRLARHERVYGLYQRALALTPEPWILTWEDDVYPQHPETWRQMNVTMRPWLAGSWGPTPVAVVGAVYEERYRPGYACASEELEAWVPTIQVEDVETARIVGSTAAGFTLWRRSDLETLPPEYLGQGWDWAANRAAARRGGKSWLVPFVCEHATGLGGAVMQSESLRVIDAMPEVDPEPEPGSWGTEVKLGLLQVDRPPAGMLKKEMLKLLIPALVNQLLAVLTEDKIREVLDFLVTQLETLVKSTPTKLDDDTVLPIAKHLRSLFN